MKQIIWLVLFMLPGVSIADQWLCVADQSNGFNYRESSDKWEQTKFTVDDDKYIVSQSKFEIYKYDVTRLGKKNSSAYCEKGFNTKGDLYCELKVKADMEMNGLMYRVFNMNHIKGRFVMSENFGYFSGFKVSPSITIGKCSKF